MGKPYVSGTYICGVNIQESTNGSSTRILIFKLFTNYETNIILTSFLGFTRHIYRM